MGYVFKKSSGRGWRLRKRSMELWPKWIDILKNDSDIKIETPLIQIAKSNEEYIKMKKLIEKRKEFGLELLDNQTITLIERKWKKIKYGGLISYKDGRLDPIKLTKALVKILLKLNVEIINYSVLNIEKGNKSDNNRWIINFTNNQAIQQNTIVLCTALGSKKLLEPHGHKINLEPVLGQAVQLRINEDKMLKFWPSVISINGINIIKKNSNKILIGATLENGYKASKSALKHLLAFEEELPAWLKNATIEYDWNGIRARPKDQPSPVLKNLEPGLIVNTGHYRNGVLIAPACAEWVEYEIKNEST